MTMNIPILEVSGLHTHYGASHILRGIDFSIRSGECLSLMGRNGMGKTTTIRSIFGLTPATKGRIRVFGNDVTTLSPHVIARMGLGLVPEGREIFPDLSVKENLTMTARPGHDGSWNWTLERVLQTFPRLAERLSNMGNQLSGGEQQILSIARALMTNPQLLVLDEATEGLAPLIRKKIWDLIQQVKKTGIATIIVDKDVDAQLKVSDKSLILVKGKVVFSGDSSELAANPDIHIQNLSL
jgi:branched-chain amino acid transport system ATP-binding protein